VDLHRLSLFLQDEVRRARVLAALSLLRDARDAALDLGVDVGEFAVEAQQLFAAGLSRTDLLWMVGKGYAAPLPGAPGGGACPLAPSLHAGLERPECSRFVLTAAGLNAWVAWQGKAARDGTAHPGRPPDVLPRWAGDLRELSWKGVVVKRFRGPAMNQETLVAAFEEEGWPRRMDDPLPPAAEIDPKARLRDTIKALNRNQLRPLLRFRGDGTGRAVQWATVPGPESPLAEEDGKAGEG
jgi:hypothetical protein